MTLLDQLIQAGYQASPDAALPLDYMARTLENIATVTDEVVEGTLHKVRTGELSLDSTMPDERRGTTTIYKYGDVECERRLTPLQQALTPVGVDVLVTDYGALKLNAYIQEIYRSAAARFVTVIDPVDASAMFKHWLQRAALGEDHVQVDGTLAGYGTLFTLARRELGDDGQAFYDPIAGLNYWPDQKRFVLLQPGQGIFTGHYDPATRSFDQVQQVQLQTTNPKNGIAFAPDMSWDWAGNKVDSIALRERHPTVDIEVVHANMVVDRFLRANTTGKPFFTAYDSAAQFWDRASGTLLTKILGTVGSAITHDRPYHPWLDAARGGVLGTDTGETRWLRDTLADPLVPGTPQLKAPIPPSPQLG